MSDSALATMILIFVAAVIGLPHLFIWSLNELFGLGIAHDLSSWAAALVLSGFLASGRGSGK